MSPYLIAATVLFSSGLGLGFYAKTTLVNASEKAAVEARLQETSRRATQIINQAGRTQQKVQETTDAHIAQIRKNQVVIGSLLSERERLRDELAVLEAARAKDSDASCRDDADWSATRELFESCAGRYAGMAEEAAGLATSLQSLQAYVRNVCPAQSSDGGRLDR